MSGFSYTAGTATQAEYGGNGLTPGDPLRGLRVTDADRVEAERRYNLAMTWKPPAGHASWCEVQLPPPWRHSHVGSTPMAARGGCTCGRSRTARLARRRELRALMESIGRKVA